MEKLTDKETGQVLGWQCHYEDVVGKEAMIVSWASIYSDKFKCQQVYLYCISSKGDALIVTTFSFYVLNWCLQHNYVLPLEVKFSKKENAQVLKTVKGEE